MVRSSGGPVDPAVAGFGKCGECAYREAGPLSRCYACARETMEPLVAFTGRCEICDLPYTGGSTYCRNHLCHRGTRAFALNYSVAMKSGELEQAIYRYKYKDMKGWGLIFGRVIAGFLAANDQTFNRFDVIIPAPIFVGLGGGRSWNHIGLTLRRADEASEGEWPIDLAEPAILEKTARTDSMAGKSLVERERIAIEQLRPALRVNRPEDVNDRRVLVYDDVFTTGTTLNVVSSVLKEAGAEMVCGLSLARQPLSW